MAGGVGADRWREAGHVGGESKQGVLRESFCVDEVTHKNSNLLMVIQALFFYT